MKIEVQMICYKWKGMWIILNAQVKPQASRKEYKTKVGKNRRDKYKTAANMAESDMVLSIII